LVVVDCNPLERVAVCIINDAIRGCPFQYAALIIPELISRNTDFGFLWLQLKVKTKVGKIQGK